MTGNEATREVLSDRSSYSTDIRHLLGDAAARHIGGLGFTDPPDHTRLSKILSPEFTMRRLEHLAPRIQQIVDRQLDVVAASGPSVDLVQSFAVPIPFEVICELIGLPAGRQAEFHKLGQARFDVSGGGISTIGAVAESRSYLFEEVRRQRKSPGDGLLGRIIRDHGDAVDDHDLGGLLDGLFTGGFETTASMLSLGTLLLRDPDHFAAVRDDDATDRVVEEMLRYLAVVQIAFPRFARNDMELFGQHVAAGDVVICSLSAATRDHASGPDMERFDPHRAPLPHYAFGHGFHRCVGAELARMELRAAYPSLARRFPEMRLAVDPQDLAFRKLSLVFGVEALPVILA